MAFGLVNMPEEPLVAWTVIAVFGFTGLVSFVSLLPGTRYRYLRLTPEGYEQRALTRTSKQSWQHIERFQVHEFKYNPHSYAFGAVPAKEDRVNRWVGFIYDPNYKSHATSRRVNGSRLFDTYGLSADELAKLMNEWLSRYKRQ